MIAAMTYNKQIGVIIKIIKYFKQIIYRRIIHR